MMLGSDWCLRCWRLWQLLSLDLPNRVDYETEVGGNILKRSITEKWRRGEISNFEYLMHLNTLAGRSFNGTTPFSHYRTTRRTRHTAHDTPHTHTHTHTTHRTQSPSGALTLFVYRLLL
jgi:hypothetical protein